MQNFQNNVGTEQGKAFVEALQKVQHTEGIKLNGAETAFQRLRKAWSRESIFLLRSAPPVPAEHSAAQILQSGAAGTARTTCASCAARSYAPAAPTPASRCLRGAELAGLLVEAVTGRRARPSALTTGNPRRLRLPMRSDVGRHERN